jgi:hypothetical protein
MEAPGQLKCKFDLPNSVMIEAQADSFRARSLYLVIGGGANSAPCESDHLIRLTASLERAQRTRLDRVLLDWEEPLQWQRPHERRNKFVQFVAWLIEVFFFGWLMSRRERKEALAFDSYLSTAHLHEEVARQLSLSSRRWFADWRLQAQMALRLGMSPETLLSLLRSTPIGKRTRAAVGRLVRPTDAATAEPRERLRNVIFPNAPGARDSLRHLMTGDGPATVRI